MQKIIAVIGNASIDNNSKQQEIAYELGKMIIDNGYILATGGLGGVMEYASKGAKYSSKYCKNSIIGILPDYMSDNQNKYIDIAIPTGLGLARNLLLISIANAVIAVGGGAGTLNEIAASWQMNKLIIGLQIDGWSKELCGKALDKRRDDIIFCAKNASEAIEILNREILNYQKRRFLGVSKPRIKEAKARETIKNHFSIKTELLFLGKGSEGFIFTDKKYVYKIIDNPPQKLALYWTLLSLSEALQQHNIKNIPNFKLSFADNDIFIKYLYEKTIDFLSFVKQKNNITINKFIVFLKQFYKIKWVSTDFQPKNLRLTNAGNIIIDLGSSFLTTSEYLFKSMCRRAFVTYKLQNKLNNTQDFKKYLSAVNKTLDLSLMSDFELLECELKQEFNEFYQQVIHANKKDILNPVVQDIFQNHIKASSILDYGSGYGDMSKLLKSMRLSVTAYEPDTEIINKYNNNYEDILILNNTTIKNEIAKKRKFDCVLCSLVLCHNLAKTKQERLKEINHIMINIVIFSKKYVVVIICNPLYTYQTCSNLQERMLNSDFNYQNETKFTKKIYSSNRTRDDIHRPLSFYESLFSKHKLDIKEIIQTNDKNNINAIKNSDFMIFILQKI